MSINSELDKIGQEIVQVLKDELNNLGLGNSDLANSISYYIKDNELIIDMNEYGEYVDSGTKPHMPPVYALEEWAKQRGLNAWGVAINIKKFGTPAQPFLFSIDPVVERIGERISDAGFDDFVKKTDSLFDKYFTKIK